jgi:two-component system response regulator AtoC
MSEMRRFQMIGQYANAAATLPRDISEGANKLPVARILVVDDERLVRWAIAETLGEQGYEISAAGDAASAKRVIVTPETAPDLVLLDLCLPDSNDLGLALFVRLQAPKTPIVLMTAFGTPEILAQAAGLGIAIITKPFDVNELASIVKRTLELRAA